MCQYTLRGRFRPRTWRLMVNVIYRSEYVALVYSFVLVALESVIRVLTLALRTSFLRNALFPQTLLQY